MKNKHLFKFFSLIVVLGLLLSACSSSTGGNGKPGKTKPGTSKPVDTNGFPLTVKNDKTAVEDGTLTYALISDTPFEGILSPLYSEGVPDSEVQQFFDESLFSTNGDYEITNDGAATYELSDDNKTMTVKIKDNVNWSDGQPVTAEDYEYTFLVLGSKDYTGVRYGDPIIQGIVGMKEYHAGKAKNISGIKIIDDKTLSITWKSANPSLLSGLWTSVAPKHLWKDTPIKDLAKSPKVHKEAIGFGPFVINKIVPGESVEYVRNDNYWRGKPKLKSIVLKVVNPKVILQALKKGEVDIASGFPTPQYTAAKNAKSFQFLGKVGFAYTYIGFKLGHWDAKKGINVMDNPKFQDKRLRQAMAYALDQKSVGEKIYNGLRFPATSLIPTAFKSWHSDEGAIVYDPEKSKKLLDEAGYKDTDGDGLREDPNGKKFKINFLSMSGDDTAEPLAKFYMQSWKNVGLDVSLVDGRLAEFNSFYKMVEADDPKIDIYQGAWSTGTDVDPYGLYGEDVAFNYSRYVNPENSKLLEEGHSEKALDHDYRKKVYDDWQKLMNDELPVIPTLYRYSLDAVNNRVKDYTIEAGKSQYVWSEVSVTSNTPDVE